MTSTRSGQLHKNCCLCAEDVEENLSDKVNILKYQITSYFVGVKILEFTRSRCAELLGNGENPFSWFSFCRKCFEKVNDAEKTFRQFLKLESEWKSLKAEIKSQMDKGCRNAKWGILEGKWENNTADNGDSPDLIKIETFEEIKAENSEELIVPDYIPRDDDCMSYDDDINYEFSEKDPLLMDGTKADSINSARVKRNPTFTQEETKKLLEIWSSDKFQIQFLNTRPHNPIWGQIAIQLFEAGKQNKVGEKFPKREYLEVKYKLNNIKKGYDAIRKNDSNRNEDDFPYYDIFEKTYEKRPLLIESFDSNDIIDTQPGTPDHYAKYSTTRVKRNPNWAEDETKVMLELWASDEFQSYYRTSRKHCLLWNTIAARLFEVGKQNSKKILQFPERTGLVVANRFRNLKRQYDAINSNNSDPYVNKEDFPYYDIFEKAYETDPMTNFAEDDEYAKAINQAPRGSRIITRCANFTEEETKAMLRIWSSEKFQRELEMSRGPRSGGGNPAVWNAIARKLFEVGKQNIPELQFPARDGLEVQRRFRNVRRENALARSNPNANPEDFAYYEFFKDSGECNKIIGEFTFNPADKDVTEDLSLTATMNEHTDTKLSEDENEITSDMCGIGEPRNQFDRMKAPRKSKHSLIPITEEDDIKFDNTAEKTEDYSVKDAVQKPRMTVRCSNFTDKETKTLLDIWGSNDIQPKFQKSKQHVKVWGEVAVKLFKAGRRNNKKSIFPKRSYLEVRNRVKNLKRIYSSIKNHTSEMEKEEFPYYDIFETTCENNLTVNNSKSIKKSNEEHRENVSANKPFTTEETKAMLEIWSSNEFQKHFTSTRRRHGIIWNLVAAQLYEIGQQNLKELQFPERDGLEVKKRFIAVKQGYVDLDTSSNFNPNDHPYYEYFKKTFPVPISKDNDTVNPVEGEIGNGGGETELSNNNDINPNSEKCIKIPKSISILTRRPKRCPNFTQEETKALVHIWGEDEIQRGFESKKSHPLIWKDITVKLFELGKQSGNKRPRFPKRDSLEVKNKLKNLRRTYSLIESEVEKEQFPYYDLFTRILKPLSLTTEVNSVNNETNLKDKPNNGISVQNSESSQQSPQKSNKNATVNKTRNCQRCGKQFTNLEELKNHVFTVHGKIIKCNLCDGLSFPTNLKLIAHVKVAHKDIDNPFVCGLCGKGFPALRGLRNHEEGPVHNAIRKFQCDICGKTFPNRRYHENHVANVHRGERNFVCEMCGSSFTSNQSLKYHKMSKHNLQESSSLSVKCDHCGRILGDPFSLRHHIESVHKKVYKFHCKICNTGRRSKSAIDKHILSAHTNKRPEVCPICHKSYADKAVLNIHMRLHTGETPYPCKVCGKAFSCSQQLSRHSSVHVEEKTFECEICQKAFASLRYLKSHYKHAHRMAKAARQPKVVVDETALLQLVAGEYPRTEKALKKCATETS